MSQYIQSVIKYVLIINPSSRVPALWVPSCTLKIGAVSWAMALVCQIHGLRLTVAPRPSNVKTR